MVRQTLLSSLQPNVALSSTGVVDQPPPPTSPSAAQTGTEAQPHNSCRGHGYKKNLTHVTWDHTAQR